VPVDGGSPLQLVPATNLNVPVMAVDDSGACYIASGSENGDIKRVQLAVPW
jgi:hypothetical protein